jgi:hypothetical protein
MIECKPYKAKFLNGNICILRQGELVGLLKIIAKRGKKIQTGGDVAMRKLTAPSRYYEISGCDGCKVGEKLYQESLERG